MFDLIKGELMAKKPWLFNPALTIVEDVTSPSATRGLFIYLKNTHPAIVDQHADKRYKDFVTLCLITKNKNGKVIRVEEFHYAI